MEASRLRTLFKKSNSLSYLLQSIRNSSSSSSSYLPAAASSKTRNFFFDEAAEGGSSVYRHALKFQRPSTIKWKEQLHNSVSFIGRVDRPPTLVKSVGGLGAFTMINVKTSPKSDQFFKIFLIMWNEMAEVSITHLKPNDCVYVSGHLQLYTKNDDNGKFKTYYKVVVKEINYVVQCGQGLNSKKPGLSDSGEGESGLEKYKKRLHLWQIFFANPYGWLDNRRRKAKPNHPDFKNKDTGEALWINCRDPPWIMRQLQLHDARLAAQQGLRDASSHSSLSPLVYDDLEEIYNL